MDHKHLDPVTFDYAVVAELADAHGSGPCGLTPVEVRVLSTAFTFNHIVRYCVSNGELFLFSIGFLCLLFSFVIIRLALISHPTIA